MGVHIMNHTPQKEVAAAPKSTAVISGMGLQEIAGGLNTPVMASSLALVLAADRASAPLGLGMEVRYACSVHYTPSTHTAWHLAPAVPLFGYSRFLCHLCRVQPPNTSDCL